MRAEQYRFTVLLVAIVALTSCGIFQQAPAPKTTAESIALVITNINIIRNAAHEQFNMGNMSVERAQSVQEILAQARLITDTAATSLNLGNEEDAVAYIGMAQEVLNRLEKVIKAKEATQ